MISKRVSRDDERARAGARDEPGRDSPHRAADSGRGDRTAHRVERENGAPYPTPDAGERPDGGV